MVTVSQANLFIKSAVVFSKQELTEADLELISSELNAIVKKDVNDGKYSSEVEISEELARLLNYID